MRFSAATVAVAFFGGLYGCTHDHQLACEPTERYASAASSGPVQIPDDLSPPDETDSLRLPSPDAVKPSTRSCLETPPGFYASGSAGGTRVATPSGRRAPTPAPAAPASEAAEKPAEPPNASSDREIGN